jgi:hypothetical protein
MRRATALIVVVVGAAAGLAGAPSARAQAEECPNAAYRTGPSAHLPDCRAYEQVSPAEKGGEDAFGEGSYSQAAEVKGAEGESNPEIAYTSKNVFAGSPGAGVQTAYRASRESAGWLTEPLTPRVLAPLPADSLSYDFSGDLSQTVVKVPETLTPEAPERVYDLFDRDAAGGYSLITAAAPSVPIPAGCETCYFEHDVPAFAGASSDFTHVIFEANESLRTTPSYPADPNGEVEDVYESNLDEPAAQRVHPVGILPDGTLASGAQPGAGGGNINAEGIQHIDHAISADGSHILFTAAADEGTAGEKNQLGLHELYDRIDGPNGKTIEVSAPATGAEAPHCPGGLGKRCKAEPAQFWEASEDGSVVLFTSKAKLTKMSDTGPEVQGEENPGDDLYRYDVQAEKLEDLTPDFTDSDGASVQGVVGASSDGSLVYFVAQGVLAGKNAEGEEPAAGKDNLYRITYEGPGKRATAFIATLAEPDEEALGDSQDWTAIPEDAQAYVTPNGEHLAFTSIMPLTGYENEDQYTEQPDKEVFEYSAPVKQGGTEAPERLECASCNPDRNKRPVGSAFIGSEIAAQSEATNPLYQTRALNEEGTRLFFSSADALVPEADTPYVKVYEYEGGAIHMISGGAAESNDIFMDSSPTGDDVFFATAQPLTPSDHDQATDVYDARVDGGFQYAISSAAPCEGEGCLPPLGAPATFAHPGSTLNGTGNLAAQGVAPAHTSKPPALTRALKLAKALKACRRKPKHRRAACERLARRRYGPPPKHGKHRHTTSGGRR